MPPFKPADRTNAPAANSAVVVLRLLKQAGCRGDRDASVQPRKVVDSAVMSQVAATPSTLLRHAGAAIRCRSPWLPLDATTTVPCVFKVSTALFKAMRYDAEASQAPANRSQVPRLRLTTSVSGCCVAIQSSAATTSDVQQIHCRHPSP